MIPCRRERSASEARIVVWRPVTVCSRSRRPERSRARRSVSSAIWRLSRSSTLSRLDSSRARKNWPSMKTEIRKMMASSIVDRASTKPGQ
jgi:hypothetical protein